MQRVEFKCVSECDVSRSRCGKKCHIRFRLGLRQSERVTRYPHNESTWRNNGKHNAGLEVVWCVTSYADVQSGHHGHA